MFILDLDFFPYLSKSYSIYCYSGTWGRVRCVRGRYSRARALHSALFILSLAAAAREDVYGVCVGGILGHALCTGLAVLGGRFIATRISVRTVTLVGIQWLIYFVNQWMGIHWLIYFVNWLFFYLCANSYAGGYWLIFYFVNWWLFYLCANFLVQIIPTCLLSHEEEWNGGGGRRPVALTRIDWISY